MQGVISPATKLNTACTEKSTLPRIDPSQHLERRIGHGHLRADPRSSDPAAGAFILGKGTLVTTRLCPLREFILAADWAQISAGERMAEGG